MSRENQKVPGIEESQYFLSFEARFHKLGFAVLLIIISLAVLGVFSDGYFSNAMSKNTTGEVTLNFERFGRLQTEFKLKISATDQHSEGVFIALVEISMRSMKQKTSGLYLTECTAREMTCIWYIIQIKIKKIWRFGYLLHQ